MMNKNIFPNVPDVVHNAVLDTLDSLESGTHDSNIISMKKAYRPAKKSGSRFSKAVVACIACFLVFGVTASAMGIVNAYRQRMEAMDEQEITENYQIANAGEATEMNRPYTENERIRYEELNSRYESGAILPQSQMTYIQSAQEYSGSGVAMDTTCRTLYLPQEELTDEELLQIIDQHHREAYSIDRKAAEILINEHPWYERMEQMSDEEVDRVYLAMFGSKLDVSGGYSRPLSESESSRLEELSRKYEEECLYASEDITVISSPEEYTGVGIALCSMDSSYYLPETELTDEDLLQYIDFEHKTNYCLDRIHHDIQMGFRTGYPEY